jgi:hypothetical protein
VAAPRERELASWEGIGAGSAAPLSNVSTRLISALILATRKALLRTTSATPYDGDLILAWVEGQLKYLFRGAPVGRSIA